REMQFIDSQAITWDHFSAAFAPGEYWLPALHTARLARHRTNVALGLLGPYPKKASEAGKVRRAARALLGHVPGWSGGHRMRWFPASPTLQHNRVRGIRPYENLAGGCCGR